VLFVGPDTTCFLPVINRLQSWHFI